MSAYKHPDDQEVEVPEEYVELLDKDENGGVKLTLLQKQNDSPDKKQQQQQQRRQPSAGKCNSISKQ
ncbi:hypothetical protein SK128_011056, partial [Halocaridina rubra]